MISDLVMCIWEKKLINARWLRCVRFEYWCWGFKFDKNKYKFICVRKKRAFFSCVVFALDFDPSVLRTNIHLLVFLVGGQFIGYPPPQHYIRGRGSTQLHWELLAALLVAEHTVPPPQCIATRVKMPAHVAAMPLGLGSLNWSAGQCPLVVIFYRDEAIKAAVCSCSCQHPPLRPSLCFWNI